MWFFGKKNKKKEKEEKQKLEKKNKEVEVEEKTEKVETKDVKTQKSEKKSNEKSDKVEKTEQLEKDKTSMSEEENEKIEKTEKKAVYRVLFDKEDKMWKIKKDGAKRIIDSKKTKEEALARVQELSKSQDTKFVVYKKDGKFQKKANLNLKNDNN